MQQFLKDMPIFVELAQHKSFTQAADHLDMPISTLSRRISALEKGLGIQLFVRSTRSVELTESGEIFFERCRFILDEVENARNYVVHQSKRPTGTIKITTLHDIYFQYMQGVFSSFAAQHPGIQLYTTFDAHWVDLETEPYDLQIRVGPLPDSDLKVRRLGTVTPAIYASPKLLEFYNPQEPQDLKHVPCICLSQFGNSLTLRKKDGTQATVKVQAAHYASSGIVNIEMALAGLGTVILAGAQATHYEKTGELVRILPEWYPPDANISLLRRPGTTPARVQLMVDFLVKYFENLSAN